MDNIIEKLLSNLVVAAFIPALVFVTIVFLLFGPIFGNFFFDRLINISGQTSIFVISAAIIVGFSLFYENELVLLLFRGRFFPRFFGFFEQRTAWRMWKEIREIDYRLCIKMNSDCDVSELRNNRKELIERTENYISTFPIYISRDRNFPNRMHEKKVKEIIEKTRLGNILSAAESYPMNRYNIYTPEMWPRLQHVIPQESIEKLNEAQYHMLLLINSSFLSFILSTMCMLSAIYYWICYLLSLNRIEGFIPFVTVQEFISLYKNNSILSLLGFLCFALLGYLFYRGSLPIAQFYAKMYCCAFDLYRFKILEKLNIPLPSDNKEELDLWDALCEQITIGPFKYVTFGEPNDRQWLYFTYSYSKDLENASIVDTTLAEE